MSKMANKLTLDRLAMKNRSTSHLRIYVGGLTEKATVEDLYEHFIQFGQIDGIVVNRSFGFVQFNLESSAQQAIIKGNGSGFQGKTLTVRTAQTNIDKKPTEVVTIVSDVPPAVALTENIAGIQHDMEDQYDSHGNYIGDQGYKEDEEEVNESWGEGRDNRDNRDIRDMRDNRDIRGGPRGRSGRARARGARGRGGAPPNFREQSPPRGRGGEWSDRGGPERGGYDRYQQSEYPRPVPVTERNDCEIIVVSRALTEYAEYIEGRLKRLGIVVDLLYPMEDVPIGKVLGNIASRGCLYAILVMPQNQEHRSLTLTILHGLPQEHRNMPLEDSLQLLSRNFQEVQRGGSTGREAVYALLGQLADGRSLTALQYDKVIEYLQERREQQVKVELGEPLSTTSTNKTQVDLQQRILSILNDKKAAESAPPSTPAKAPTPVPAPATSQTKLLNDPTVRKALDTILNKFV